MAAGRRRLLRGAAAGDAQLNVADANALLAENNNVVTDLSKLGKAGTKFTHDFFLSATLLSFPQDAVGEVAKLPGVTSAVPGLIQRVQHETGTVPDIVASIKTGGKTYTQTTRPAPLTDAERQAFQECLAAKGVTIGAAPADGGGRDRWTATAGWRRRRRRRRWVRVRRRQPRVRRLPARAVPASSTHRSRCRSQTINQVVNPPSTDITNTHYDAAGVDPAKQHSGLITVDQLTKGRWFAQNATNEVLISTSYADTNKLDVGSKLTINGKTYDVVGLVKPSLTGGTADVYFPLATLQNLAGKQDRVTQILVSAKNSSDVDKVAAEIKQALPGAEVVTTKQLADQATGSLADAHSLAGSVGGALAVIVLAAAFVIAALLTLSSISKRVREIGTLRAIGWSKGRVVRQLVGETMGIAVIGGVFGLLIGAGVCWAVNQSSTTLTANTVGVAGTASGSTAGLIGLAQSTASSTTQVALSASLTPATLVLGLVFALVGGLVAGLVGSWRAARLAPAAALRDIG